MHFSGVLRFYIFPWQELFFLSSDQAHHNALHEIQNLYCSQPKPSMQIYYCDQSPIYSLIFNPPPLLPTLPLRVLTKENLSPPTKSHLTSNNPFHYPLPPIESKSTNPSFLHTYMNPPPSLSFHRSQPSKCVLRGAGLGWRGGGKRGGENVGKQGGENEGKQGGEITPVHNVHPRGEGLAYFMEWFYLLGLFSVGEGEVWCDGCRGLV